MCTSVCVCVFARAFAYQCGGACSCWSVSVQPQCACDCVCALLLASARLVNREAGVLAEIPAIDDATREFHRRARGFYSTELVSPLVRLGV
jgi:hypothetical protein